MRGISRAVTWRTGDDLSAAADVGQSWSNPNGDITRTIVRTLLDSQTRGLILDTHGSTGTREVLIKSSSDRIALILCLSPIMTVSHNILKVQKENHGSMLMDGVKIVAKMTVSDHLQSRWLEEAP
jgi:hypothetical protein